MIQMKIKRILSLFIFVSLIIGCQGSEQGFEFEEIDMTAVDMPQGFFKEDFRSKGSLSPTIYYHPVLADDGKSCRGKKPLPMKAEDGQTLISVCPQTLSKCRLEGSCQILRNDEIFSFNYKHSKPGYPVFFEIEDTGCIFGFGVQNICLDPFYTVAADLRYHKPGDVIFVPKIKGVLLPSGRWHDGFLIVRDRGAAIQGQHRFDFFTGAYEFDDPENPFKALGLSDHRARLEYYKLTDSGALKVRQNRKFPMLPTNRYLEY